MVYKQRGDTLVEVLMSLMVLSTVIVGAVTLMSRGLQSAQIALEHSQTRQEVNKQIELLRYVRDQYATNGNLGDGAVWANIVGTSNATQTNYNGCAVTPSKSASAFYLERTSGGGVQRTDFNAGNQPTTYAVAGQGLWVEAATSTGITPAYIDFVVRACWVGTGSTGGQQRTVTAVRLYDPSR